MKNNCLLLVVACFLSVLLILGCSSKNSTEPIELTEGDPNDPAYLETQELTEAYIDSAIVTVVQAVGFLGFDGSTFMSATEDSLSIEFDVSSCWWELYASADSNGFSFVVADSLKFTQASGCQVFPDSNTTTEIELRIHHNLNFVDDSLDLSLVSEMSAEATGLQTNVITINSTGANITSGVAGSMSGNSEYEYTIVDLQFLSEEVRGENQAYPLSGDLYLSLSFSMTTNSGLVNYDWTVHVTFSSTGYHARAESGDNYWEWDGTYEG